MQRKLVAAGSPAGPPPTTATWRRPDALQRRRVLPALLQRLIAHVCAFEPADRQRLVVAAAVAGGLARVVADAPGDRREGVVQQREPGAVHRRCAPGRSGGDLAAHRAQAWWQGEGAWIWRRGGARCRWMPSVVPVVQMVGTGFTIAPVRQVTARPRGRGPAGHRRSAPARVDTHWLAGGPPAVARPSRASRHAPRRDVLVVQARRPRHHGLDQHFRAQARACASAPSSAG